MSTARTTLTFPALMLTASAQGADDGWRTLFNGNDLSGWKANAAPLSWTVQDGAIRANATTASSHLFYVGNQEPFEKFVNFELEVMARSEPEAHDPKSVHFFKSVRIHALP